MDLGAIADIAQASADAADSDFPLPRANMSSAVSRPEPRGNREFVALSRFTVAQMTDEVKRAFEQRPHHVDEAAGFLRMEVLSPCDAPDEIWLITYWADESSYRTWHRSHLYQESHRGIPKGLRLVPKSVSIRCFEHVAK